MFLRMPLSYIRSKDLKQINLFWESGQEGIPPQFVFHVGVNPAVIKACTHLLLVPLFVSAFRIAQDLAMAMEARCYRGGEHRTRMNEMKLKTRNYTAFVLMVLFLAAIIIESRIF